MTITFTASLFILCIVAAGLGAFARWIVGQLKWPDWVCFWMGVFVALLVFASFRVS